MPHQPLRRIDPADTQALLDQLLARSPKVAPPVTLMTATEVQTASSIARHLGPEKLAEYNRANATKSAAPAPAPTVPADVAFDRIVQGFTETTTARDFDDLVVAGAKEFAKCSG